jgi:hypothetical protein
MRFEKRILINVNMASNNTRNSAREPIGLAAVNDRGGTKPRSPGGLTGRCRFN